MSNEESIKASILLMLLKCIVASYSNGNKSFTGRLFPNYRPLSMLFHFFFTISHLYYSVFHETFVKKFTKLSFFSSNFKNPFQDIVYYRKLGYWNSGPLNKGKKLKNFSVFGVLFSEIKKCWHFKFSWINISVTISHFSQNDIYGSTIVEITGRRTWK